jgi:hypothetical protein
MMLTWVMVTLVMVVLIHSPAQATQPAATAAAAAAAAMAVTQAVVTEMTVVVFLLDRLVKMVLQKVVSLTMTTWVERLNVKTKVSLHGVNNI